MILVNELYIVNTFFSFSKFLVIMKLETESLLMKDKDFDIALGQALRDEREKRNLVQDDIAEKLSVTKMTISNYETGKRAMTAKMLKQYCSVLGVTIQSVIDRADA